MLGAILLAIATAFMAAALGSIATNAPAPLLVSFLLISVAAGASAVAWESPSVRRRLPFARPFTMRHRFGMPSTHDLLDRRFTVTVPGAHSERRLELTAMTPTVTARTKTDAPIATASPLPPPPPPVVIDIRPDRIKTIPTIPTRMATPIAAR
jgi:hypothetical protein